MKAQVLVQNGSADQAFELQDRPTPEPGPGQVRIKVECFGLNFADVMARQGLYRDAPPLPSVLGYEVVGTLDQLGEGVVGIAEGQRVVAFTRFGGYAEYALTDSRDIAPVSEAMDGAQATALATQYGTAYFCACEMTRLFPGDKVLVQAAAGGVGTALVQLAKHAGCEVYGTAGGPEKVDYLRKIGVDHPIDYQKQDFYELIAQMHTQPALDVVFDSIGGTTYSKGLKLLNAGGRMVSFGAAKRSGNGGFLSTLKLMWCCGIVLPVQLIMHSRAAIGVNMLRIADKKPEVLQRVMQAVVDLYNEGVLEPQVGGKFPVEELANAHHLLETRKTTGKVAIFWQ
ncbi:MAG: zinc-binding alcohol dehydrogenase family protein [Salibacteraceae bacterium]